MIFYWRRQVFKTVRIYIRIFVLAGVFFLGFPVIAVSSNPAGYSVYVVPAITNEQPPSATNAKMISAFASPGEFESVSFIIKAPDKKLENVKVNIEHLNGEKGTIPVEAIDIRIVKYWYQAGRKIYDVDHKILTPELLVHDDRLIRVDLEREVNYIPSTIQDSTSLLPFDVPAKSFKHLWITVHVPKDFAPGTYTGLIKIAPANAPMRELEIRFEVFPIKLSKPILGYSIYYRGKLPTGKNPKYENPREIGAEWKSEKQMKAELRDMVDHGIGNPVVYQPFIFNADGRYDFSQLKKVIEIRKSVGIVNKPLLYNGMSKAGLRDSKEVKELKRMVKAILDFSKENGVPGVYIYGIDEAEGERLKAEREGFIAIHEVGGRVFVACRKGAIKLVGDLLDLAIHSGVPSISDIRKVHKFGHKIYNYANPQFGVEEPLTYRRNYGFLLWQQGLDGTCSYAYQTSHENIWNDFDDHRYRDHVMAYPTNNGVIPTIQWEGFREGVDDIRYLSTLLNLIEAFKESGNLKIRRKLVDAKNLIEEIRKLDLGKLEPSDFQDIRRKLAIQIINLQKHINENKSL